MAERVPYFAIPRYVEFRDDLPRNPVGRVLKYQLRDEGVTAGHLGPRGRRASRSSAGSPASDTRSGRVGTPVDLLGGVDRSSR